MNTRTNKYFVSGQYLPKSVIKTNSREVEMVFFQHWVCLTDVSDASTAEDFNNGILEIVLKGLRSENPGQLIAAQNVRLLSVMLIDSSPGDTSVNTVGDDYHTMQEVYEHRNWLFVKLCNYTYKHNYWKSKKHDDGSDIEEGWFLAGITNNDNNEITYHLPIDLWDQLKVRERDTCPPYDGYTSKDVLERLKKL